MKLPYAGKLVLTLKDGQTFELRDIEKGKNPLMSGKMAVADYKFSLTERPELDGLDLRGASATITTGTEDTDLTADGLNDGAGDAGTGNEGMDAMGTTEPV